MRLLALRKQQGAADRARTRAGSRRGAAAAAAAAAASGKAGVASGGGGGSGAGGSAGEAGFGSVRFCLGLVGLVCFLFLFFGWSCY